MLRPRLVPASWFVTAALAGAATACAGAEDDGIDLTYDPCAPLALALEPAAADDERAAVLGGLELWNAAAGTRLTLAEPAGAPRLAVRYDDAASAFYGFYDDTRGIVWINRRLVDPRARALTVAHELGHAFGLAHVPPDERPSLMNPGNLVVAPTPADVAALHALWGSCGELASRR